MYSHDPEYFIQALHQFNSSRTAENFQILLHEVLNRGQSIDLQFKNGYTLLHYAVKYNLEEDSKKLLHAGASCSLNNKSGKTPIDLAIENGNQVILHLLARSHITSKGSHYYQRKEKLTLFFFLSQFVVRLQSMTNTITKYLSYQINIPNLSTIHFTNIFILKIFAIPKPEITAISSTNN